MEPQYQREHFRCSILIFDFRFSYVHSKYLTTNSSSLVSTRLPFVGIVRRTTRAHRPSSSPVPELPLSYTAVASAVAATSTASTTNSRRSGETAKHGPGPSPYRQVSQQTSLKKKTCLSRCSGVENTRDWDMTGSQLRLTELQRQDPTPARRIARMPSSSRCSLPERHFPLRQSLLGFRRAPPR